MAEQQTKPTAVSSRLVWFAPRKTDLPSYITSGSAGREKLLKKLGKHKAAEACLYVKRVAAIDLAVLEDLVRSSVDYVTAQVNKRGAS